MLVISLRIAWFPGPDGRGAIRTRDLEIWETALWCRRCHVLGYDHGDIDALLEAQRLGIDHATRVASCGSCGALRCDACATKAPCCAEGS